MAASLLSLLPNEMIDQISNDLSGLDLFHFMLVYESSLNINNAYLIRLLYGQSTLSLNAEVQSLLTMLRSPYIIVEDDLSIKSSSCRWKKFVYGPFKSNVIEKSLKYFPTTLFTLYCRLWSFNPFYYQSTYPVLEIFKYSCMISNHFPMRNCPIIV